MRQIVYNRQGLGGGPSAKSARLTRAGSSLLSDTLKANFSPADRPLQHVWLT